MNANDPHLYAAGLRPPRAPPLSKVCLVGNLPDDISTFMQQFLASRRAEQPNRPKPLDIVRSAFPFDVQPEHQADALHYAVREHGDYVATGGRDWHEDRRRALRGFYSMLHQENLIITYSELDGWGHQQRLLDDEDMIMRIENPTDEQEIIWQFPPDDLLP